MAEILLSPLLDNLISSLGSALVKEIRVVWGVEEEVESLSRTLSAIRSLMAEAEEKQVQNNILRDWLRKLKDAAYDAEDVVDIFSFEAIQTKPTGDSKKRKEVRNLCSCFCLKKVAFRHEIGNKILDIRKRLDEIANEHTQFHLSETSVARPIQKRPYSVSLIDAPTVVPTVVGREEEKDELIKKLLVPNGSINEKHPTVIPIVALGGLGKTTLARLVYNSEGVEKHFEVKGWVCLSDRFDLVRVTRDIVESISTVKCNVIQPERHLKNLIEGKRFLIVLDDVWDDALEYWDDFRIPFTYGDKGSKLIVTTRSEIVSRVMGSYDPIHLNGLPDEDCLELLLRKAFVNDYEERDPILVDIGKKIVKKCAGVPLAINTLGGLLVCERSQSEWKCVLESSFWELPQQKNSILPALRLSYQNLPEEVKPCFTFCSLFPKDYKFDKDVLIRMWMAQGYIQSDRLREVEDVGDKYFNVLLMRSFFSRCSYSKNEYTMHDLVHDLAESLAKNEFVRLHDSKLDQINETNSILERVHHAYLISEEEIISFDDIKRCERLRTLVVGELCTPLFDVDAHVCPSIIPKFKYLRVLSLNSRPIQRLPNDLGSLRLLRYIDFSWTPIEELPDSICNLLYLQSLDLKYCLKLKKLPDDLGSLRQLRYIDFSRTLIKELPDSICNLLYLQSLNLEYCGKLKKLPDDLGRLRQLRYIDFSGTHFEELPDSICNFLNLQSLLLENCADLKKLPDNMSSLTNLRHLNIEYCRLTCMPPQIGKLTNLREISLFIVGEEAGKKILELKGLNSLKGKLTIQLLENVVDGEEAKEADLKNKQLKSLKLCWAWIEARDGSIDEDVLENLQPPINLVHLTLEGYQGTSLPSWLLNLSSLELLDVRDCRELTSFPEDLEKLGSLELLYLRNCPKISSLPRCGLPKSLKDFFIIGCPLLKESMSIYGSIDEDGFENLQPHINLEYLNLGGYLGTCLPSWLSNLSFLKDLDLHDCRELASLPEDLEKLGSLEILKLRNCPKISSLPRCGLPKSLKDLYIIGCPLLKESMSIYGSIDEDGFENLQPHINLKYLKLEGYQGTCLPSWLSNLSSLKSLDLCNCPKISSLPRCGLPKSLEYLRINKCPLLWESTSIDGSIDEDGLENLPPNINLESLTLNGYQGIGLPSWLLNLSSLKSLDLLDCRELASLPEDLEKLGSLESLVLVNCPKISSLPRCGLPKSLKVLRIRGLCPLLKESCNKDNGRDWPKIANIPTIDID